MPEPLQLLVRLDLGEVAVVEATGLLEPDNLLELAAVVRRTQRLDDAIVVDVSRAEPDALTLELLDELARGRQGCLPFAVRGAVLSPAGP